MGPSEYVGLLMQKGMECINFLLGKGRSKTNLLKSAGLEHMVGFLRLYYSGVILHIQEGPKLLLLFRW